MAFPAASVIGLHSGEGKVTLDPPPDTVIQDDDLVVAIAADDDRLEIGPIPEPWAPRHVPNRAVSPLVEHILVVGWNDLGPMVLRELDANVGPGSTVTVMVDPSWLDPALVQLPTTPHLSATLVAVDRSAASEAFESILGEHRLEHVVLLCYRNRSAAESDAQTLLSLLQLRYLLSSLPEDAPQPSIATELLDSRDVHLAELERTDDFVVSERLTSLMMTQLAENPELQRVFDDVFAAAGTQIVLQPAPQELLGRSVTYRDVIRQSVASAGVVIGWRVTDPETGEPAMRLNPPKDQTVTFDAKDRLIVMRGDRRRSVSSGCRGLVSVG